MCSFVLIARSGVKDVDAFKASRADGWCWARCHCSELCNYPPKENTHMLQHCHRNVLYCKHWSVWFVQLVLWAAGQQLVNLHGYCGGWCVKHLLRLRHGASENCHPKSSFFILLCCCSTLLPVTFRVHFYTSLFFSLNILLAPEDQLRSFVCVSRHMLNNRVSLVWTSSRW